jgi:peptidyl-prolyl cis-trans isomerase B (cyclophilin B)
MRTTRSFILALAALLIVPALVFAQAGEPAAKSPAGQAGKEAPAMAKPKPAVPHGGRTFVRLETTDGSILLVLQPEIAPHHAANFAHLAKTGFYNGTYFHRVIPGFMIQGGDPNTKNDNRGDDGRGNPTWQDVLTPEELATPAAKAAAMEKKGFVDNYGQPGLKAEFSSTAKHKRGILSMARTNDPNTAGSQFFVMVADYPSLDGKYSIFGHVVTGMDVADKIVSSPKDQNDNPLTPHKIIKATVMQGEGQLTPAEKAAWQKEGGK